jgi:hypothetical protein
VKSVDQVRRLDSRLNQHRGCERVAVEIEDFQRSIFWAGVRKPSIMEEVGGRVAPAVRASTRLGGR